MNKRYDFKEAELRLLDKWNDDKTYFQTKEKGKNGPKFYFLQGPPYTSGNIHIGHAWNNSSKDVILRYKRMRGFDVWDRAGYDMHGLPTANKVQKKLGLKNKDEIVKYGLDKFIEECKQFSIKYAKLMDKDLLRLGIWMDYDNAYYPIKNEFIEGEWFFIKKAHEKNRLYKGKKVMTWCGHCETALAKHELEYEKLKDNSIYLKFKIQDTENEFLIIWTTTPWTIPFNLAVMVNPELMYVKIKVNNETWIVAKERLEAFSKSKDLEYEIIDEIKGEDLEGVKYIHPFNDSIDFENDNVESLHTILLSKEYVDTSAGTGLVHCAPGCGPEDYEVGVSYGLKPFNKLNEQGVFTDIPSFNGLRAKTDDKKFIELFKEKDCLVGKETIEHDYAHCWRCHNPVIFKTTEQWFLKVEDIKQEILENNKNVQWVPKESKDSYEKWVSNLKDNTITRQRFWGCPVPIWECECGHHEVIGDRKELEEKSLNDLPEDLHRPYIDKVKIKCSVCDKEMSRIPDVLDVWIDSGTASWNCLEYPHRTDYFEKYFPADFILEGNEQTRLWFNMLQICSRIAFDKSCYNNVYTTGMILDFGGVKMSKSLGNIISPYEIVDKYGADILRYYLCKLTAGKNMNFSWEDVKLKQRNLNVLWNIHNFLIDLDKQVSKDVVASEYSIEEKYIISKLNSTIKIVTEKLDKYYIDEVIGIIEEFYLDLSRVYIQMVRDKLNESEENKKLVYNTIKKCLFETLKMFSIITPYITEEIYLNLKDIFLSKESSIHLLDWPTYEESEINTKLEESVKFTNQIIQSALAAREKAKISLRWPIKEMIISSEDPFMEEVLKDMESILKAQINVKSIKVGTIEGIKHQASLNFRNAGKKFGTDTGDLIVAFKEIDGEKAYESIKNEGTFKLDKFDLSEDEIIFEKVIPEGFTYSDFSKGTIYLNTERTEELEKEGFTREIIRRIQSLRKEKGLEKKDKIKLHIISPISLEDDKIKHVCGVETLTISDKEEGSDFSNVDEFEIKGNDFMIFFDKI